MFRYLVFLVTLFLMSVTFIACAGFDHGKADYQRGVYVGGAEQIKAVVGITDPEAQFWLGLKYQKGDGVPQDYDEALKWYTKAAEQGHVTAQNNLGLLYAYGPEKLRDYAKALKWLRIAAEQGDPNAQHSLGSIYFFGMGVPKDYAEALRWCRKAAEQGDAGAQYDLGMAYANGKGVAQNYAEAMKWLNKAAEQGHVGAKTVLKALSTTEIPLEKRSGVYELPVKINGVLTLNFVLDTGASEVHIPADVALTLLRTGTITQSDFLPGKFYELADGTIVKGSRFIIRELDIGGIRISQVPASVGPANASLLLGQSFLGRLQSWSLDNKRHVFMIGGGTVHPR